MKFTASALVFFCAIAGGCHKHAEEASAATHAASPAVASDAGVVSLVAPAPPDAGSERMTTGVAQSALHPRGRASSAAEGCVDRWLKAHHLDRFGADPGTMYTGGTPLFDERTGETRDRVEFVYAQHPEAKKACAGKLDGGAAE